MSTAWKSSVADFMRRWSSSAIGRIERFEWLGGYVLVIYVSNARDKSFPAAVIDWETRRVYIVVNTRVEITNELLGYLRTGVFIRDTMLHYNKSGKTIRALPAPNRAVHYRNYRLFPSVRMFVEGSSPRLVSPEGHVPSLKDAASWKFRKDVIEGDEAAIDLLKRLHTFGWHTAKHEMDKETLDLYTKRAYGEERDGIFRKASKLAFIRLAPVPFNEILTVSAGMNNLGAPFTAEEVEAAILKHRPHIDMREVSIMSNDDARLMCVEIGYNQHIPWKKVLETLCPGSSMSDRMVKWSHGGCRGYKFPLYREILEANAGVAADPGGDHAMMYNFYIALLSLGVEYFCVNEMRALAQTALSSMRGGVWYTGELYDRGERAPITFDVPEAAWMW